MAVEETELETIQYRLVLVEPASHEVFALDAGGESRLPRISIPPWTRPAEQLQRVGKAVWGADMLVLDYLPAQDASGCCVVAELVAPNIRNDLQLVPAGAIASCELSGEQRIRLAEILSGRTLSPFARLGWIDEAIAWVESATERKLFAKSRLEQLNAGEGFSLIRFAMEDGAEYWLKATGEPNAHELPITYCLSALCEGYLPQVISTKPSWNAWLMSGDATQLTKLPDDAKELSLLLGHAVESMAKLQMKAAGHASALLNAGAFDHGIECFLRHSEPLFEYLEEAMALQVSTKVPRLGRSRLLEIRSIVEDVCRRVEDLGVPQSIVHGDLNHGNILIGPGCCQFIDWSEAYFGNPLISLQHLLLLNRLQNAKLRERINLALKQRYRDTWARDLDPASFDAAFVYMPLLAIVSSLVGRGDRLTSSNRNRSECQANARSLARYMDRAAREPELLETLSQ